MRRSLALLALTALAACEPPSSTPATRAQAMKLQTIATTPPQPAQLTGPQMLMDEAPPPQPKALPWETQTPIVFSPEDEKLRAGLPFSPAIAMDPVNGDKISMRAATPTYEYKGKIFYFASEANKRTFIANPEAYSKGGMMRL